MTINRRLLILVAGPYLSGTNGDPQRIAANLAALEAQALPIHQRGHLALVGEWLALPIIRSAGGEHPGDPVFQQYQYPVARRLLERCDGVLRIAGDSKGADQDVALARQRGLPIYHQVDQIPLYAESADQAS